MSSDYEHVYSSASTNSHTILSDNYIITQKLGSGSFGEVYMAEDRKGGYVAAKVEDRKKLPRILNEYKIYNYLYKHGFTLGLPKTYEFIQTADYNIMFMQLLGPSLEDKFNESNKIFSLATVLKLADQLISLIEMLHLANFIHRDIKPNNFLIGYNDPTQVYMMDFGLSKKYIKKGVHIPLRDDRSLIGTARYASINMHLGIEPTRRDDLESIGYMLIYFLKGKLPWQGLKRVKNKDNLEVIGEIKIRTSLDFLCYGIPDCFKEYLIIVRALAFDETPNYDNLRRIFHRASIALNITPTFDWIK